MRSALLSGASVLTLTAALGTAPALAQVTINSPQPTLVISTPIAGDVTNNSTIGTTSTPTAIHVTGAGSIAGDLLNNGNVLATEIGILVESSAITGALINNGSVDVLFSTVANAPVTLTGVGILQNTPTAGSAFRFQNAGEIIVDMSGSAIGFGANVEAYGYAGQSDPTVASTFDLVNSNALTAVAEAYSSNLSATAAAVGVFIAGGKTLGTVVNSDDIYAEAYADGNAASSARAIGIEILADANGLLVTNTGSIEAFAGVDNFGSVNATAVYMGSNPAGIYTEANSPVFDGGTFVNNGGTLIATMTNDDGTTRVLGNAIDVADGRDAIIELKGENQDGYILGDILLNGLGAEVRVSRGETLFDGRINPSMTRVGDLSIFGGGTFRMGNGTEYEGYSFVPSVAYVDDLYVESDGTLAFNLGAGQVAGTDYGQVFANDAEIEGTLLAHFTNDLYAIGDYTYANVINVVAGLDGSDVFDYVISNTPLMQVGAVYNPAGQIDILATRIAFGDVEGLTDNQQDVADYIDTVYGLGGSAYNNLFGEFFTLEDRDAYAAALDALSGREYAQNLQIQLASFDELDNILLGRWLPSDRAYEPFRYAPTWNGGAAAGAARGVGYKPEPQASVWARGFATMSGSDGDPNGPGYASLMGGGYAGADAMINPNLMAGVAGGYVLEDVDYASGNRLNYQGAQGAGYALFDNGASFGRALVGYAYYQNHSERDVNIGTIAEMASADYISQAVHGYAELGHRLVDIGDMWISPYASASYTIGWVDGFTETGLTAGNLRVDPATASSLVAGAGMQFEGENAMFGATLITRGRVAYEYEFLDGAAVTSSFSGIPGNASFTVVGEDTSRGVIVAGMGATMEFSTMTRVSLDYKGRFAEGYMDNSASVGVQQKF